MTADIFYIQPATAVTVDGPQQEPYPAGRFQVLPEHCQQDCGVNNDGLRSARCRADGPSLMDKNWLGVEREVSRRVWHTTGKGCATTGSRTAALELLLGVDERPVGNTGSVFGGLPERDSRSLNLDASLCSQL